jgi:hypothetical protein
MILKGGSALVTSLLMTAGWNYNQATSNPGSFLGLDLSPIGGQNLANPGLT